MAKTSLEHKRHTLAHLLAAAVIETYKDREAAIKLAIGPAIDNGFYYDFHFGPEIKIGETDLPKIEEKMREILQSWKEFTKKEVDEQVAKSTVGNNEFKHYLIDKIIAEKNPISLYKAGSFEDLCRGGHAKNPSEEISLDSFKLDRVAGAYWLGDEKKPMLTRIYGLAFETKDELDAYLTQREEALKRDHRKLGKELDLFITSELVGAGLPLWTPRGTIIRKELDAFVQELRSKYGYQGVTIPHFTKKDLYETSGHWSKFSDELFRIQTREGKEYAVKPMNCPHHTQIFARKPHSYRDMPQRYSETTMVYRDEQSGELGGLTRVLSITQDDSHVFCRMNQVKQEFFNIWDIVDTFYGSFGFTLRVRLSFHDPENMEKYLGTKEVWSNAESALLQIAKERNADYFEAPGEAAMYGPKLDFMATDSMGRQHQVATIQLDMNLPERFDLTCTNEKGEKERIVMIHCAIMGSIERFSAVLIEHLGGVFPVWLSPVQVTIVPVSDAQAEYAKQIEENLKSVGVRVETDASNESLGKRIRAAKLAKVPYYIVVGDNEVQANNVTLEDRSGAKQQLAREELITRLKEEIRTRKA